MALSHVAITHQYSLSAPGGGTRSCLQIMKYLQQMGVSVTAIQVTRESSHADLRPISVITVKPNSAHYLLTGVSVAKAVKSVMAQQPVDAVLSWGYEAAFLPQMLRKENVVFGMIAAAPSYKEWIDRETSFKCAKGLTDGWFRWRPFKLADVVYTSSNFTKEELRELFLLDAKKISVTGRGIDAVFNRVRQVRAKKTSSFIFYGSLAPIKGVLDAVAALGIVAKRGYLDWNLKIAGWGDTSLIIEAAKEQGILANITLLGRLEPDELASELARADLAMLPSRAESFGRSIAEAQAASLPVVSYSVGSIPEVVESGVTGWLAPAGRTDMLADAVIEAINNPDKTFAMGKAGHNRVTDLFTWERTAEAIVEGIEAAKKRLETSVMNAN